MNGEVNRASLLEDLSPGASDTMLLVAPGGVNVDVEVSGDECVRAGEVRLEDAFGDICLPAGGQVNRDACERVGGGLRGERGLNGVSIDDNAV